MLELTHRVLYLCTIFSLPISFGHNTFCLNLEIIMKSVDCMSKEFLRNWKEKPLES